MINFETRKINGREFRIQVRDEADRSVVAEIFKWREYHAIEPIITTAKNAIIDAGAHIGVFTLYCRAFNPTAKVYCLEPEPNNFRLLKENITLNKVKSIGIIAAALSDRTGKQKLLITPDSHNHQLSHDSLIDPQKTITVKTLNFSDLCSENKIKAVSLLKMDIEGEEFAVIDNLSAKNIRLIDYIFLEYHQNGQNSPKNLEINLRDKGFSVQIFPSKFDKKMGFILAHNKNINKS
jgi:FkbM family methyltransferase